MWKWQYRLLNIFVSSYDNNDILQYVMNLFLVNPRRFQDYEDERDEDNLEEDDIQKEGKFR